MGLNRFERAHHDNPEPTPWDARLLRRSSLMAASRDPRRTSALPKRQGRYLAIFRLSAGTAPSGWSRCRSLSLTAAAPALCFYEHLHPFACSDASGICSKGVRVEGRNWVANGRQAKVGEWQLLAPTFSELAIPLPATGRP